MCKVNFVNRFSRCYFVIYVDSLEIFIAVRMSLVTDKFKIDVYLLGTINSF
jgi:hypothetical protein